jgi:type IV pilus assembly protein PilY1
VASDPCGDLENVTNVADVPADPDVIDGWYINLDNLDAGAELAAERVITDPLTSPTGLVLFTSFMPSTDVCSFAAGESFVWGVKYNTGGSGGALLKGKALLQVSTGSIEQKDLSTTFTEKGGRRTPGVQGVPPTHQGLSLLGTPPPLKRILHIREK